MCRDNQSWVGEEWDEDDGRALTENNDLYQSEANDDDRVEVGMSRLSISEGVQKEGLGYTNVEELRLVEPES